MLVRVCGSMFSIAVFIQYAQALGFVKHPEKYFYNGCAHVLSLPSESELHRGVILVADSKHGRDALGLAELLSVFTHSETSNSRCVLLRVEDEEEVLYQHDFIVGVDLERCGGIVKVITLCAFDESVLAWFHSFVCRPRLYWVYLGV
jgi:hypothetical protein